MERALAYPRLQALWPLTPEDIPEYTQALDDLAEMVQPGSVSTAVIKDPNDDPVIGTAILGRADFLCTLDRHFYTSQVLDFLGKYRIEVMNDLQLLERLRSSTARK